MSRYATLLRGGAAFAVLLWCSVAGATPITVVTEGEGPLERVVRFERNAADPFIASDARIDAIADAIAASRDADRTVQTLNLGLEMIGDVTGGAGFFATLGEHALGMDSLFRVNALLTYGGLIAAGIEAANSLRAGNSDDAAVTSYKGVISFTISRFGWGSLQVAGASLFLFDLTLRSWGRATVATAEDRWRESYREFYREQGRSVNDWKEIVWNLYLQAERRNPEDRDAGANAFATYMQGEVNRFVNAAFGGDPASLADGGGGLLSSFAYGNRSVAETLAAEQRTALEAMLARDVLPEIAERAAERQLLQVIDRYNLYLRDEMNALIRLDVTFWGHEGANQVRIPHDRGEWGGTLGPDGTFTMEFTRLAWLRAGLPDRVLVDTASGTIEAPLSVIENTAIAVFGVPPTATISRFTLTEGPRDCTERLIDPGTRQVIQVLDRYEAPALGQTTLDTATLTSGLVIGGRFDPAALRWDDASPASFHADRDALIFGPPRVDNLAEIRGCSISMFSPTNQLMTGSCTFVRRLDYPERGVLRERYCMGSGDIVLSGVFADMGDGMTYYPTDNQAMQDSIDAIRQGMRDAGMDPDALFGPDGAPYMMTIPGMTMPMEGN